MTLEHDLESQRCQTCLHVPRYGLGGIQDYYWAFDAIAPGRTRMLPPADNVRA